MHIQDWLKWVYALKPHHNRAAMERNWLTWTFIGFFGDYISRKVQVVFQSNKIGFINKSELYGYHSSEKLKRNVKTWIGIFSSDIYVILSDQNRFNAQYWCKNHSISLIILFFWFNHNNIYWKWWTFQLFWPVGTTSLL